MELKRVQQTETEKMQDKVYACMETGNTGQARTLMTELRMAYPIAYAVIRTAIIRDYGVSL